MGFQAAFLETGSNLPSELIDTQHCEQSPRQGNLPPLASGAASPLGHTVSIQLCHLESLMNNQTPAPGGFNTANDQN